MKRVTVATITALSALAGCAGGPGLNPLGWFRGDAPVAAVRGEAEAPEDLATVPEAKMPDEPLVPGLSAARLEPGMGGALLIAEAEPPTTGYWQPKLQIVQRPTRAGPRLRVAFTALPPEGEQPAGGPPAARRITAGRRLPDTLLEQAEAIEVIGAAGAIVISR
mgnify:CR=1 FL=1